ncbi:hypothetical protein BgiBS90_012058, partial [Biomphalaria glabrata]
HMSDSAPEIMFNLKNRKPPDQITLPIVEQSVSGQRWSQSCACQSSTITPMPR